MWRRVGQSCLLVLVFVVVSVAGARTGVLAASGVVTEPPENMAYLEVFATGVQVYVCTAKTDDSGAYEWTFKAPVAELRNEYGDKLGTHFAGPTWEGNDGSTVVGAVVERANAPDPHDIPWLLLRATSHAGAGIFTPVTYIQRLETVGGVAPSDGCDASTAEAEAAVDYSATYVFFVGRDDAM